MRRKIINILLLLVLFIINSYLVLNNYYHNIDFKIHELVFDFQSAFITKFMKTITFLGSTPFVVTICIILFIVFMIKSKIRYALCTTIVLIISTIFNNVIKIVTKRDRPLYIMVVENSYSYPSGHTMASCTLYGFLIYIVIRSKIEMKYKILLSILLGLLIILIGISRIYLGAHYFSDVFGGMIFSLMLIGLFDILSTRYKLM